jgi:hypothetical protein
MAQKSLRKWIQERKDVIPEDPFAGAAIQPFESRHAFKEFGRNER